MGGDEAVGPITGEDQRLDQSRNGHIVAPPHGSCCEILLMVDVWDQDTVADLRKTLNVATLGVDIVPRGRGSYILDGQWMMMNSISINKG